MVGAISDWRDELGRWLKPFLNRLGHKARRRMCPLYVSGLLGPGDRKSIQPMAERLAVGEYDQLHHFLAARGWDPRPVDTELLVERVALGCASGGSLAIVHTRLPQQLHRSVAVPAPAASRLG